MGNIPSALASYEQEITRRFEDIVITQLCKLGLCASRFKSQIGTGTKRIPIPDDIGEIDFLAYWPDHEMVIVGDDKLVKPVHEPATYRDDIDKFIGNKKNYADQVKRKTQWVLENIRNIEDALSEAQGFPDCVKVRHVAPVLVTYFPAFASYFIPDVPCVALTELISDIKSNGSWRYEPLHDAQTS